MKTARFTILPVVLIAIFILSSCKHRCIKGSGKQITETHKTGEFTSIELEGGYKVNLKQDSSASLTITGDDNILKFIKMQVEGNKLHIYTKKSFCESGKIVINIGVKHLQELDATGGVELVSDGKLNVKDLAINLSGGCTTDMDLTAANLHTVVTGGAQIKLKGEASSHSLEVTGSADVDALDFVVGSYTIQTTGASDCKINVLHDLSVHSTGASDVKYRGNPTTINTDKSGAASVTKIN